MPDTRQLNSDEWRLLRKLRLSALAESPDSFLATHDIEKNYGESKWRDEFARGNWHVGTLDGAVVGLVGVTREDGMTHEECYLEYIWIAAGLRGSGFATQMVTQVLNGLRKSGVRTTYLWVMDGNETAVKFYTRLGFRATDERHAIDARPGRSEERFRKDLE
ncbi:MAG TPA: GNAT family N-acetyltransferase [Streptosporangiaceae bacterium]|nr:GNAT family N-acetyltransferase [Streptosporangiaceae bacterium]